jgi:acyl-CoA thioesterase
MGPDPQALAQRCAAAMYAKDLASQRAGVSLDDVGPGRAVTRMPVTDAMVNGHEICHGAYIFLVADAALAFACNCYNEVTVAQACHIVFLHPARPGDVLVAEASERQRARRTGIYDVTVRTSSGTVVAEFRGHTRTMAGTILHDEEV